MWFTSDNAGPAHPAMLEAISAANDGYCGSYGADPISARVEAQVREIFEAPNAKVFLAATGSAVNAIALGALCPPWGTVFCHTNAHVEEDECGAPEFYTNGAKLTLVPGDHGKMDPEALRRTIAHTGRGGVHNVQRGAVTLTNVTELGGVYSAAEAAGIGAAAAEFGLPLHMDGARFANALAASGATPAEMSWKAGVDILSLGASKNGAMAAEAIVLFEPEALHARMGGDKAWEIELRRKRGGHLFSKMRYVSAQMDAWLKDGLWLQLASQANARAAALAEGLRGANGVEFLHPVDANMLFISAPRGAHKRAQAAGAHYYMWPFDQSLEGPEDEMLSCRLVCNWATTERDVEDLARLFGG
ncbi:threonine aldolase family protein [Rhodovulum sp. DZ06]|uniref:threonine aldolase family protein n=1 Tax=Rhodovulum sp. DZ06 TaxID=3425126 RepID=UPI003D356E79